MIPIPKNVNGWLNEIAKAYLDAMETIPFIDIVNQKVEEKDLFHLAPAISIKFRGIKKTRKLLDMVTEAALSSYITNQEENKEFLASPVNSFAFCYLTCHYAINLLSKKNVDEVLKAIEADPMRLQRILLKGNLK